MSGKRKGRVNEGANLGEVRAPAQSRSQPAVVDTNINLNDVLTDEQIAAQRSAQAVKMANDAKALLAEAARLQKEADDLLGATKKNDARKTKKTAIKET
jgi:hypothetical protein